MMRRVVSVSAILCAIAVLAPVRAGADPGAGPVVQTDAGEVASVVDGAVVEWRAVPYASPPVGDLRWRPPAPPEPWIGVRRAAEFAPQCIQLGIDGDASGS
jgi:para-nitrobenzyl esterase